MPVNQSISAKRVSVSMEPERNVYLRSELRAFIATLEAIGANSPNDEYRRGWLAALQALAMLVQIEIEAD